MLFSFGRFLFDVRSWQQHSRGLDDKHRQIEGLHRDVQEIDRLKEKTRYQEDITQKTE